MIAAEVVLLHDRLTDAKRVDALANDLNGLIESAILEVGLEGRLHGQRPSAVRSGSDFVLLAVARIEHAPDVGTAIRWRAVDLNQLRMVLRIRLDDGIRRQSNAVRCQILLNVGRVAVGGDADCLIDHNLQDEAGAAFEIEAQMNSVEERLLEGRPGESAGDSRDSENANHEHGNDQNGFLSEILTHGNSGMELFGPLVGCGDGSNRAFDHFHPDIVGRNAKLDGVVLDAGVGSPNAAAGGDAVAGLQIVEHLLPSLLFLLIGPDEKQIEDDDDKDEGQKLD